MQEYVCSSVARQNFPREDLKERFKKELRGIIIAWVKM
jgi:hypothetical protein